MGNIANSWKDNLKENRPKLYKSLEASGDLDKRANAVEEMYKEAVASLMESGMTPVMAQQTAREMYLSTQAEGQDLLASNLSSM